MAINIGSAVAYLELDTSKFSKGFKTAYNDLKVFSDKSATAGNKLRGLSSTFDTVGKSLTKTVTVPLVGIGTAAVKTAAQFDSNMSEVKAISSATGEQFTQLRNKAIEMGAKTKYSASESAQAFKYMAMAGWDTKDMLNSISGVMNLAAASGEDLASVSDIVTDAMTAFGLSADGTTKVIKNGLTVEVSNATHFADVLAQASRKSNTNVAMMGETFKYVAPVAGALGYSVEDTAVAIGLMANSGIKATQAGTTLRTLLTNMAKPTDTMQAAMDYLGVSLETTDGKMKSFSEVMQDLRKSFGQCKMPMDTFKKKLAEIEAAHESGELTETSIVGIDSNFFFVTDILFLLYLPVFDFPNTVILKTYHMCFYLFIIKTFCFISCIHNAWIKFFQFLLNCKNICFKFRILIFWNINKKRINRTFRTNFKR